MVTLNCGSSPVTINITSSNDISANTTIEGPVNGSGNPLVTLRANGPGFRLFLIKYQKSLTLRNLIIENFTVSANNNGGAAIMGEWQGNLTLNNTRFNSNTFSYTGTKNSTNYDFGGAIFIAGGMLDVDKSEFRQNVSNDSGGAAIHIVGGSAKILNSYFFQNKSTGHGNGGAYYHDQVTDNGSGFIEVRNTTFEENESQAEGGAIRNNVDNGFDGSQTYTATYDNVRFINNTVRKSPTRQAIGGAMRLGAGRFNLSNLYFYNNRSERQGGAIWIGEVSIFKLEKSAIIANTANDPAPCCGDPGQYGFGGGISIAASGNSSFDISNTTIDGNYSGFNGGGIFLPNGKPVTLTNVTITNNTAWWQGGGLANGNASVILKNTLLAYNTAQNGGNNWNIMHNCTLSGYTSGGGNLQYSNLNTGSSENCVNDVTLLKSEPKLETGGSYGTNTWFRPLKTGSPAINTGTNSGCPSTDQRSKIRPQQGTCDIGAWEYPTQPPTVAKAFGAANVIRNGVTTVTFTLNNPNPAGISGVAFTDVMPVSLKVANPRTVNTTAPCNTGSIDAQVNNNIIAVSGISMGASTSCTITVNITGTEIGQFTNTTQAITSTDSDPGKTSNSVNLTVIAPIFQATPLVNSNRFIVGVVAIPGQKSASLTVKNTGDPATTLNVTFNSLTGSNLSVSGLPLNLTGGQTGAITVTCNRSSLGKITETLTLTTNDKGLSNQNKTIELVCYGGREVTKNLDDGTTNTLSWALEQASIDEGVVINLSNNDPITFTSGTSLPPLKSGVILEGKCNSSGPTVVIDGTNAGGDGLRLYGQNILSGLQVINFPGKEILLQNSTNNPSTGHIMLCTRTQSP